MTLTFLTLATLPLAAAGPGASVETLDGEGARCAGYSDWWSSSGGDNDSWWSYSGASRSTQCADHFDYAAAEAHDDDGEVASVSLSADSRNASGDSYSESSSSSWRGSSWSNSWHNHQQQTWSRDAAVSTRAGDAGASYGCVTSSNQSQWNSWSYDGWGNWGSNGYNSAYADRCGLDAEALGEGAFAGTTCRSYSGDYSRYNSWDTGSSGEQFRSGYNHCLTGVESDAATAGWTTGCASEGLGRSESSWNGNESIERSWSTDTTACTNGVAVVGPDGAVVFAGTESTETEDCQDDACTTNTQRAGVVRLAWAHNPLQPGEMGLYQPLP